LRSCDESARLSRPNRSRCVPVEAAIQVPLYGRLMNLVEERRPTDNAHLARPRAAGGRAWHGHGYKDEPCYAWTGPELDEDVARAREAVRSAACSAACTVLKGFTPTAENSHELGCPFSLQEARGPASSRNEASARHPSFTSLGGARSCLPKHQHHQQARLLAVLPSR